MARVRSTHHILGVEHLAGEFGDGQGAVLLVATRGQWGEPSHKEVESWEGHHVGSNLAKVGVELSWESQGAGDS